MDCNSYSYAPDMLENAHYIESFENDDMAATIEKSARGPYKNGKWKQGFEVWANSYDGELDVCKFFTSLDAAKDYYNRVIENRKITVNRT